MAGLRRNGARQVRLVALSFVAVAAVVEVFALQVSSAGVVHAGDSVTEAVHAPADPSLSTTGWLTLQAKEKHKRPNESLDISKTWLMKGGVRTCLRLKKPFLSQLGT